MNTQKLIHRSFFEEFSNEGDPYLKFLLSWRTEMPDFEIKKWNSDSFNSREYEWTSKAYSENQPVFISELVRWKALSEYGGLYLDADCEIVNGEKLGSLIEECEASQDYDAFVGVEDFERGAPTAQTVYSKKNSDLVKFMLDLYANRLAPFWIWRESKLLLGPDLMSLYFFEHGATADNGFFPHLREPVVVGRVKVYPQAYFSPKFGILGHTLNITEDTCVYHAFTNGNIIFDVPKMQSIQQSPLLMREYLEWCSTDSENNKTANFRRQAKKVKWVVKNIPKIFHKVQQVYRSI